jgi:hypothetical protein
MKLISILIAVFAVACVSNAENEKINKQDSNVQKTSEIKNDSIPVKGIDKINSSETNQQNNEPNIYANARFKEVVVEKIGLGKFRIVGKGQLFEAALSWIIEDGHNEIYKGFETADAGGPAWGNFNFTVSASKKRPNSTLHIILFEASAKDGSRQHELIIPLPD